MHLSRPASTTLALSEIFLAIVSGAASSITISIPSRASANLKKMSPHPKQTRKKTEPLREKEPAGIGAVSFSDGRGFLFGAHGSRRAVGGVAANDARRTARTNTHVVSAPERSLRNAGCITRTYSPCSPHGSPSGQNEDGASTFATPSVNVAPRETSPPDQFS